MWIVQTIVVVCINRDCSVSSIFHASHVCLFIFKNGQNQAENHNQEHPDPWRNGSASDSRSGRTTKATREITTKNHKQM